jgi:hypothetical protein
MTLYTTIHFHNVPAGREAAYARWFDGPHRAAVAALRGYRSTDRYELTREQIMPEIPQPWCFVSIYDFDLPNPAIDIPALGPLIAEARDEGLVADDDTERLHTYRLYSDWKGGPNWRQSEPFSGVFIILANYIAGRRAEYQRWYEEVHSGEVTDVPGNVAMKRGELSPLQIEPRSYCPGDQLVLCAQQTDDLLFTITDFSARALEQSPSGIVMQTRSSSASTARTVHFFRKVSGEKFWGRGIAYAGDLSVYPGKSNDDRV